MHLPSNHHDLGGSLVEMVRRNLGLLSQAVPPLFQNDSMALVANSGFTQATSCDAFLTKPDPANGQGCYEHAVAPDSAVQLGNLAWLAHNLWMQWRYTQSSDVLTSALVPALRGAVKYYYRLSMRANGKIHLPLAESPEYANAVDTNYDLALLRWGAGTLLRISNDTDAISSTDPDIAEWRDVVDNLAAFPTDSKTGLLIGDGVELTHGHRHWSHLFSIFPTTQLDPSVCSRSLHPPTHPFLSRSARRPHAF